MANLYWIIQQVRFMKWSLGLAVVLCLLEMASFLGVTGIQKWLIDEVFINSQYDKLAYLLIIFVLLIIGYNGIHLFYFMQAQANEFRLQKKLSIQLMAYLYKMKASKYHNERIGSLAQRFTSDVGETSRFVAHFIPNGITNIIKVIVLSAFVGGSNPILLLLVCSMSLAFILIGKYFAPQNKAMSKKVQESRADLIVQIEEGISSTREVIAYHRKDWELKKVNQSFGRFFEQVMLEGKLQNRQMAWSEPFRWGMNLAVLGYGAYLAITQQISIGTFVVIYQFSAQLLEGIGRSFAFVMNFSSKIGVTERIREFMTETEPEGGMKLEGNIQEIVFDKVDFKYTEESGYVLQGLELKLPAGLKLALVGSSGGGKSTVGQLLERFFEPVAGEIRVNGTNLQEISLLCWRSRINLVSQEPYLFSDTIRNNLLMGRNGMTDQDLIAACEAAEIHTYISGLPDGYETMLGERGITLSGGQRQRLAIARSLLSNAEILIFDEATSALDLETERRVQRNLDNLRSGKTTIIIAHRLSTIENADVIYVMDGGKVKSKGNHDSLLQDDALYRKLVLSQESGNQD